MEQQKDTLALNHHVGQLLVQLNDPAVVLWGMSPARCSHPPTPRRHAMTRALGLRMTCVRGSVG